MEERNIVLLNRKFVTGSTLQLIREKNRTRIKDTPYTLTNSARCDPARL